MIKAKYDHRQYRMTKNLSGLKVLLVHDPKATQSAIALTVAAGHFQDPKNCLGLAHLLEHCLFSGCKRYPEENQINHYIESNGGQINAWTAAEMSGFTIDCAHQDFSLCNDMLSNMITHPLFPSECIAKEVEAIDAEFQYKKHEDQRRIQEVDKETSNPAHPFSQFSSGNKACYSTHTEQALTQALRQFHQEHYHAGTICLCLVSPLSFEEMNRDIVPLYDDIPKAKAVNEAITSPLITATENKKCINIEPLRDIRSLMLCFALPDIHQWYETKPESVISVLLGDEEQGSLLWHFKQQGWATQLTAGTGIQGSNFKDYTLNIQLTELGMKHTDDIIESVFSYLALVKDEGLPSWRFEALKQLNQLEFDYQESSKIGKLAAHFCAQMHYYPDELIAYGEYMVETPDRELGQHLLSFFTPDNLRIKHIYKGVKCHQTSQWYHTPYSVTDIPESLLKRLYSPKPNANFHLPKTNEFIPTDLSIYPVETRFVVPQKIASHSNGELWFGQDDEFQQPKKELFVSLGCKRLNHTMQAAAQTRIWTSAAQAYINDHFYDASTAGVFSHVYPHKRGVTLHVAGFAQHHDKVAHKVIDALLKPEIIQPYFQQAKAQRLRALNNSLFNKPINRLFATLNNLMHEHSFLPEELTQVIADTDIVQTQSVAQLIKKGYWQAMAYGNWNEASALEMGHHLSHIFTNSSAENYENKVLNLTELQKKNVLLNCHQEESALVYYLQGQANTLKDKAICIAIEQLLAPDYYQTMRYEKQYGYQLGCGYLPFMKAPGIALYIQSPVTSADHLHADTESFLQAMPDKVRQLPEEAWHRTLLALERQLGANDQNLSIKCQRLWAALDNENQNFDEFDLIKKELRTISLEEVAHYLFRLLNNKNRNISLLCLGDKKINQASYKNQLISIADFRSQSKVYM